MKPVYPTTTGENSQIYGDQITRNNICESKNWFETFSLMLHPGKNPPRFLTYPTMQREIMLFRKSISPSRKGEQTIDFMLK